jgi:hypothetical protein
LANDDDVGSGVGKDHRVGELTQRDLRLGKKAFRVKTVLCGIGFFACLGIAIFVFLSVPWHTRMLYDGKYSRDGSGIPMQIAMLPCLAVLLGFWRSGRKPDAHHMSKGSRTVYYILSPAIIVGCVWGQWTMGESILTAGRYFTG